MYWAEPDIYELKKAMRYTYETQGLIYKIEPVWGDFYFILLIT